MMRYLLTAIVLATVAIPLMARDQSDFDAPRRSDALLNDAPPPENFRVENAVYSGESRQPVCESVTIFHNGTVYDCMKSPAETILFERLSGRFVLLNLDRKIRAELSIGQIASFTEEIKLFASQSRDPVSKFLAEPKFQEQYDPATGAMTFESPLVSYRLSLVPESNPAVVEQYREFSDWLAKINSLLTTGSRPPFGRLAVNAAVAQRQYMVSEVVLKVESGKGKDRRPLVMRSEHRVVRPLSPADLDRVREARDQMGSFKFVNFFEYRKAAK
jgi:hypothetical protein